MPIRDAYRIGEVAAMLGVSPHTIRAWERRHGMIEPQRTTARHRRYRDEDIRLLRAVKRTIELDGFSVKLAFQAASGRLEPSEALAVGVRSRSHERLVVPDIAGIWRAVSDVLPLLIVIIDQEGRMVEANIEVVRMLGSVRQRVAGRSFLDMVDPVDRGKAARLYEPQFRTVNGWDLNLTTRHGPRLYSFQTWLVREDGRALLAMAGSNAHPLGQVPSLDADRPPAGAAMPPPGLGMPIAFLDDPFQKLIDHLPSGVAVVTVGLEPRLVYWNSRLVQSLRISETRLTGTRLGELIPDPGLPKKLREVMELGEPRNVRVLAGGSGYRMPDRQVALDLALRPLFSNDRKITAVLLVVGGARGEAAMDQRAVALIAAAPLERATSVDQLAEASLGRLSSLMPEASFAISLSQPAQHRGTQTNFHLTPRWAETADQLLQGPVGSLVSQVGVTGLAAQITGRDGASRWVVTAEPVLPGTHYGVTGALGVVVWRLPATAALSARQRASLAACLADLAVATELLHLRSEVSRSSARWQTFLAAASVVRDSTPGPMGLGVRLLEHLMKLIGADFAAICTTTDTELVIEAAHGAGSVGAKPGDRFKLRPGYFVSESVKTREPIAITRTEVASELAHQLRSTLGHIRHGLSVPLVEDGRVQGAIVLFRAAGRPFTKDDVALVEALSSVALLAVGRTWPTRLP